MDLPSPTPSSNGSGPVSPSPSSGSGFQVSWAPIGILMSYTLVFIVGMCFLNARSQRQPLKARSPGLLAVSSLGGYLQVIWVTVWSSHVIDLGSQEGCSLGAWSMTIGHPLLFIPYVLRCYRLHLIFNLTLEKESSATTTVDNGKYYHSRKHRISDTFLLRIMAVVFLIAACVAGVDEWLLWQGLGSWQRLYVCNYTAKSFIAVWDAVRFLETLIFTISLYKLWKVVDAFSIRMELVGVCSIWVINLMLRVVLGIYDPKKEYWVIVQPYAIIARSTVCLFVSVIVPVAWSMLGKKRSGIMLWSENAALRSLRDTLHDPEYVKAFQRFLVKRFSVENVLFWMEVELYRAISLEVEAQFNDGGGGGASRGGGAGSNGGGRDHRLYYSEEAGAFGGSNNSDDRTAVQLEAQAIVERYLMPEAHLALTNVKDATKLRIERSVQAGICTSDLFDDAQNMVYEYLQQECWDDFLNSHDCRRAMKKVKRQETIRSRLIRAGMIDRSVL